MQKFQKETILHWAISCSLLVLTFISGMYLPSLWFLLPIFITINYFLLVKKANGQIDRFSKKNLLILIYLALNLAFTFSIGYSIPFMESNGKYNFALIILPLSLILNLIILRRHRYYRKQSIRTQSKKEVRDQEEEEEEEEASTKNKPIIKFEGKKYIFSINSLIILAVGTPILSYLIYLLFDLPQNYWLHEIVVKQTAYFLNLFFDMGATVSYEAIGKYHWSFNIPGRASIYFETFCTGIQAICVFAGLILCTPHSQDDETNRDILWRKTKALVVSSVIFYVVNILRMLIQLELYHIGYAWADIHYSISAASSFIAAIIILLLHKWIPEFIISIIYIGTLITRPIKIKRKESLVNSAMDNGKVDMSQFRKYLRIDKKHYKEKIEKIADQFGYRTKNEQLIIPQEKVEGFVSELEKKIPFEIESKKEESHGQN
ncbi:MAG: archaeosortase H [Promethearchaeia archaeon]